MRRDASGSRQEGVRIIWRQNGVSMTSNDTGPWTRGDEVHQMGYTWQCMHETLAPTAFGGNSGSGRS